jgi:hypothetical protein
VLEILLLPVLTLLTMMVSKILEFQIVYCIKIWVGYYIHVGRSCMTLVFLTNDSDPMLLIIFVILSSLMHIHTYIHTYV